MKKTNLTLTTVTMAIFLAASANAGESMPPPPAPPPPPDIYGLGWYGAIEIGANVWQDRGDTRTFTNSFGDTLTIDPTDDTGFFGGVKIGYVFGTGGVRFALEEDMFYNGWQSGADSALTINGVTTTNSRSIDINTGVFMTNGILRFGTGPFQPYIGAGIGVYYGESAGATFGPFETGGGESHSDFAWQVIAGADYYFNHKTSIFFEYKYLNYTSQPEFGETRDFAQQLVGLGLRFHF